MPVVDHPARRLTRKLETIYSLDNLIKRRWLVPVEEYYSSAEALDQYQTIRRLYDGYVYSPAVKNLRDAIKTQIANSILNSHRDRVDDPDELWLAYVVDHFDELVRNIGQQVKDRLTTDPYVGHVMQGNPAMAGIIAVDQLVFAIGEHLDLGPVYAYYHTPQLRNIHIYDLQAKAYSATIRDSYLCTIPTARTIDGLVTQGAQFVARRGRGVASEWSSRVPARSVPNIHGYRVALRRVTPAEVSVYISIRFHRASAVHLSDLVKSQMLSEDQALLLSHAVTNEQSLIVAGAPGVGKTTLMRVLTRFIPRTAKLLVIENEEELRLSEFVCDEYGSPWHFDCLNHVERQGTADGAPAITAQQLLANGLQEDKDRIIVGEVRDGHTMLQLLKAANLGSRGVMTTLHASNVEDVLERVRALIEETDYPSHAADRLIVQALDWVVHVAAFPQPDGSVRHRVSGLGQVTRGENVPVISPLWTYDPRTDTWQSTPLAERTMRALRSDADAGHIVAIGE